MKVRVWGCRGSTPAPGPLTVRYGGNTSCVEVRTEDAHLILDAGTGIRALGASGSVQHATLLLTHYHWDHIQGLPFFAPAYDDSAHLSVYGPMSEGMGPQHLIGGQMMPPYFPAAPSQMNGVRAWHSTPDEPFTVGSAVVTAKRVSHPGVTYGYRIEDGGAVLVYISDNEPNFATPELMDGMVDLARGADLLLHDCQYAEAEYPAHRGWGHSSPRQAVTLAQRAGVRSLMLFHHDPGHDDQQVAAMLEAVRDLAPGLSVCLAEEGSETIVRAAAAEQTAVKLAG